MHDQINPVSPDSSAEQSATAQPVQDANHFEISSEAALQQAAIRLIGLARREVMVVLAGFHPVLNEQAIAQALLDFITDSPKREAMLVLNTLEEQKHSSHALVRVAQRLSRVPLKQVSSPIEAPVKAEHFYIISDRKHVLRIDNIDQNHGWLNLDNAPYASPYVERILQQWHTAQEIREFRQFLL